MLDCAFIEQYSGGFEAYAAEVSAASWDEIVEQSGIAKAHILEIAEILGGSARSTERLPDF